MGEGNWTPAAHGPSMKATLKGIRKRAGFTADRLAEFCEVTERAIFAFEAGDWPSQYLTDVYGDLAREKVA
jgi:predicted transcriptional regulator